MGTVTKVAKKSSSKKKSKQALVHAEGPTCFWVTDGRVITNLLELRDALATMSDDVYQYHVREGRNDFAHWIHDVLHDAELAETLGGAQKPKAAHRCIVTRLKVYDV